MVAKQVADLVTAARGLLVFIFPWLGLVQGDAALPWVGLLLVADWTGDCIDGPLARSSRIHSKSWIGDHDLEVDMAVAIGLTFYMLAAGFVDMVVGVAYLLLAGLYFRRFGVLRAPGMLFQAPVYAWFLYTALNAAPAVGWWMVAWILAAVVITWPRFPDEVIPEFLAGIRKTLERDFRTDD